MSNLPAWAATALAEAGLDESGWELDLSSGEWVKFYIAPTALTLVTYVCVAEHGGVAIETPGFGTTIPCDAAPYDLPAAFQLASRLSAALEGRADPRVQELEAEVERLKEVCQSILDDFDEPDHPVYVTMEQERLIRAALSLPEQEPAGGEE